MFVSNELGGVADARVGGNNACAHPRSDVSKGFFWELEIPPSALAVINDSTVIELFSRKKKTTTTRYDDDDDDGDPSWRHIVRANNIILRVSIELSSSPSSSSGS